MRQESSKRGRWSIGFKAVDGFIGFQCHKFSPYNFLQGHRVARVQKGGPRHRESKITILTNLAAICFEHTCNVCVVFHCMLFQCQQFHLVQDVIDRML